MKRRCSHGKEVGVKAFPQDQEQRHEAGFTTLRQSCRGCTVGF